jgi:hypothetical protein
MRFAIYLLFLVAMMLAAETGAATAQSGHYYPWCFRNDRTESSSLSCFYMTRDQCMATLSGLGGACIENPYPLPPATRGQADVSAPGRRIGR